MPAFVGGHVRFSLFHGGAIPAGRLDFEPDLTERETTAARLADHTGIDPELLVAQGVDVTAVTITGETRANISLAEPDGTLTKINAVGPELTPGEAALLLDTVRTCSGGSAWIACCSSLPRGLRPEWYADLVLRTHEAGARIALDTSGPALLAALPARPDVIKPNAEELAEAVGRPLATLGDVVKAAEELRSLGAGAVLASLGGDGQLLVSDEGTHYGTAPAPAVRSNVGAGDAALAGFLIAGGTGPGPGALASALAHGAAAVQLPGSTMPTPSDLRPEAVRITQDLPLDLPLSAPATA
ncbi:hexose kinase [Streptomyces sp. NBC_00162]|uniref:hexose kinase n=1 Tax=Streptomyces sp. NBC_00162 TaxID=2903629 RepID=UPI00214C5485|nr:hexose kinase [Streptomyces sp. NBC_00162]UUU41567.1 hexose kinase [Streptomyces sp. NBC_00162]